jgi:hypothetical protein
MMILAYNPMPIKKTAYAGFSVPFVGWRRRTAIGTRRGEGGDGRKAADFPLDNWRT